MTATKRKRGSRPIVIDLFSGTGGFSLGAARAGFDVRCAVEIDYHALKAHQLNFPNSLHLDQDISLLKGTALKKFAGITNGDLAGLVGGPPCQGFSCIGRNSSRDSRNRLFDHFFRLVHETMPKFFVAENVPGILAKRNSGIRERALNRVEKEYVLLPPITVAANEWGAPTSRTRIFFIGYRKNEMDGLDTRNFVPSPNIGKVLVKDALKGLPKKVSEDWRTEADGWRIVKTDGKGFYAERLHGHVPPGVGDSRALERLRRERRASGFLGTVHSKSILKRYGKVPPGTRDPISRSPKLDPNGFCPTLRAGTGLDAGRFQAVRPLHPTENRVITPREAARLQGFPDWYQFSDTRWHSFRLIGNSVSPIVAERVLTAVARALDQ
jgi:DNA (cytosine-5)-methyltransferase 1